ncbi:MAG: DUF2807 domain-containing protein [Prevotella sp.]|nr:DUF2807 domain-containing protein [Prevotella sp.]
MNRIIQTLSLAMVLTALPAATNAQTQLSKAFTDFARNKEAFVTKDFGLTKDPETGKKTSQYTIYNFEMPASEQTAIKTLLNAFEQDSDEAFNIVSGDMRNPQHSQNSKVALAVGDARTHSSVSIGAPGCQYIYALFLDPEDPEKKYRYAYAMEWKTEDQTISGKLVITYAIRMDKRIGNSLRTDYFQNFPQQIQLPDDLESALESASRIEIPELNSFNFSKSIHTDGEGKTCHATFDPFTNVIINANANVTIIQSKSKECKVETTGNSIADYHFYHNQDNLVINSSNSSQGDIVIYVPQLNTIIENGSGKLTIDEMATQKLALVNNNSATIRINDLTAQTVVMENNFNGEIHIGGVVNTAIINNYGMGNIHAADLDANNVTINLTGTGNTQCHADVSISGTLKGTGNLEYSGNPDNNSLRREGLGSIKHIDRTNQRKQGKDYQARLSKAQKERQEAIRQAQKAREEAIRQAQKDREEAIRQAQKDREEAIRQAQKAKKKAAKAAAKRNRN